jgi:acetylornithine deacetylase/succinyl-diaminopimelate desuccinylase-like protein
MEAALAYARRNAERFVEELKGLVRFPTVSTDPSRAHDMRACADHLRKSLQSIGLRASVYDTPGHPLVYGEWLGAKDAPTLLVYGHYDVQPAEPLEEWDHAPFDPVVKDGWIIARGASDDKGQFLAHMKAAESYLATAGRLPINLKILLEGEEETGSEHLTAFLEEHRSMLACDVLVVSDSSMVDVGKPAICYGLRGICYLEIRVVGPSRDLHSGGFGGAVVNPANALTAVLASLMQDDGRIAVKGFYDDVTPLQDAERARIGAVPFDEHRFMRDVGVSELHGEVGYSVLERLWARPSLDINGLSGGFQGSGAKTVLPSSAGAKLSCRLVPGQDAAKIAELIVAHLRKHLPRGVRLDATVLHGNNAFFTSPDSPVFDAARAALRNTFGTDPAFIREGGSIPVVPELQGALGCPVLLVGFGLREDWPHSPNERFLLENFHRGIEASVRLLPELARIELGRS